MTEISSIVGERNVQNYPQNLHRKTLQLDAKSGHQVKMKHKINQS